MTQHTRTRTRAAALALGLGTLLGVAGCSSDDVYYADDSERIVTGRIDIQDVERFSKELSEALIASGALSSPDGPAQVVIDTYANNTSQPEIDRNRVLFPLLTTLNRSGTAQGYLGKTVAGGGLKTVEAEQDRRVFEGEQVERPYDYAIAVNLYEQRGDTGKIQQVSFIIQFQVVDVEKGTPVWMDQRTITKQDRRRGIGL